MRKILRNLVNPVYFHFKRQRAAGLWPASDKRYNHGHPLAIPYHILLT